MKHIIKTTKKLQKKMLTFSNLELYLFGHG